ncbi:MAG: hypothetical protein IPO93_08395 [Actinobacteria bacterium]|jgi:hypothetical protein|nr:hypothetical protein [Actinomycetota bacterium]
MTEPDARWGVTSRVRPAPGRKRQWRISDGLVFALPVIVDHMFVDPDTGVTGWLIEATVDLVDDVPALTRLDARSSGGLDLVRMQREFRWASPLDIVTRAIPQLLSKGIDPFAFDYPLTGYPDAADVGKAVNAPLTDAFLEEIAREYLDVGRGYARTISIERQVSPRTVISWVEKARRRGILTPVAQGGFGGTIVPRSRRH